MTRTEDTPWQIVDTPVDLFIKEQNNLDLKLVTHCQNTNMLSVDSRIKG